MTLCVAKFATLKYLYSIQSLVCNLLRSKILQTQYDAMQADSE